jgi:hypothetical protein
VSFPITPGQTVTGTSTQYGIPTALRVDYTDAPGDYIRITNTNGFTICSLAQFPGGHGFSTSTPYADGGTAYIVINNTSC